MNHAPLPPNSRPRRRQALRGALVLAAALALAGTASAQSSDALRFIVPYPAGGAADAMARVIVDRLKDEMKQTVIIENRAGASTRLAAEMLKQSAPDGNTVLMTTLDTAVIGPMVFKNLRYNPATDFTPITMVATITYGLTVSGTNPSKTLAQFIAAARADKNQAVVGVSGLGSTLHFLAYDFVRQSKVPDMTIVPFQGGPAMVNNLIGGQLASAIDGLGVFVKHHQAGRLRVLATSGERRAPQLPDVPTFRELGMPSLAFGSAYALYAPAGTPKARIDEWNAAMRKVLARADVRALVTEIGYEPLDGSDPAEVTLRETQRREHWAPIVKATGYTGD
ncbi:MAG: ABC transporter substrate-binding protein [Proteobacteria bacterium]|nr:ABC transporter substrate-binding protein [Pseudomonadota bacterium]